MVVGSFKKMVEIFNYFSPHLISMSLMNGITSTSNWFEQAFATDTDSSFRVTRCFKVQFRCLNRKFALIIFTLVELAEVKIEVEIRDKKGAVLYDGRSNNCMHFTAIIPSYYTSYEVRENNTTNSYSVPHLKLLAMSLMGQASDGDTK